MATVTRRTMSPELAERFERDVLPYRSSLQRSAFISGYRKRQREPLIATGDSEQLLASRPSVHQAAATQSAEEQALGRMPADELTSALRALPEEFLLAVYLIDVEGLTYRETAAIMGSPIGTVMSRLHRGRTSLRSRLTAAAC